jgi:hypothetical protein
MSEPQWLFLFFIVAWFSLSALLSWLAGWPILTTRFLAKQIDLDGQRFRFVSGSVGRLKWLPVSYRSCLFFTVTDRGFLLSLSFPFNIFSRPLFIPWREVESVTEKRLWFFDRAIIRICDFSVRIIVYDRVAQAILTAHESYLSN